MKSTYGVNIKALAIIITVLFINSCTLFSFENDISHTSDNKAVTPTANTLRPSSTSQVSKLTPSAASKKQTPLLDDPVSSARYLLLRESDQVLLVNPATGEARKVEVDGGELQKVINVIQNGCELIGKLSDYRIVIIDLQGRIKSRILDSGWDQNIGPVFQESVSPNGKWMAYIVGRGVQGYDSWEKQDVQIINIAD